jgi:two-component system sensor histidine kinase QseC
MYAGKVVKNSMKEISIDMADSLYKNSNGNIALDDSQVLLKWGFDAFYSHMAYRLIDVDKQTVVLFSAPEATKGFILDGISLNIPMKFSRLEHINASLYRMEVTLDESRYYFDFARNDRVRELINEAVGPAMIRVGTTFIIIAFLLFISVSFVAIRLIVKPASLLTHQIEEIKPEDLEKRIAIIDVPRELLPIANAMNDALERVENSFEQQKRFIADAAHELRTPLTIFLNRLELKIPASSAKNELINDAQYISRIVEQLLDLSRAQNMSDQKITEIKLVDIAKSVCLHLASLAVDKEQDLEFVDNNEASEISVDEGELTVVIKNLLENAIKHSPIGAKIKVSVEGKSLIVEDSGKGVPLVYQNQIFERFWRENQSDRTGSGLGLAITTELLSHYGASIKMSNESVLGGAKFIVSFL